jgi:hypothetical protein
LTTGKIAAKTRKKMFNAEVIQIVPSELGELLDCHFDR